MLKRLTPREQFEALLSEYSPIIRRAFLESVGDLRSGVALGRLIEHLERHEIDQAINALNIDRAAYSSLEDAVRRAYTGGGQATTGGMPTLRDPSGAKVVIRFDAQATRAINWLQQNSLSETMVRIDKDAARVMMVEGLSRGRGARSIGLDVAGRLNRATGRREGGVIGLSVPQVDHVVSMRERLLSGNPDEMRKVFTMTRRDKRFDRSIAKAIDAGKPVTADDVARMTGRYSDRLLELRGTTIARTEGMAAFNESSVEAYRQAMDRGAVNEADLQKTWIAAGDGRTRHAHMSMNGQKVGFNSTFTAPNGETMKYPHDPDASPALRVNCRCRMDISIDFLARFRRRT